MSQEGKQRLTRLIAILTQLQTKSLVTAQELATRHVVSIRTIYRDIRTLEASGIPIVTEEGKGYCLVEGFKMSPLSFTKEESNALITAERLMSLNKDSSVVAAFQNAIIKIRSILRYDEKDKAALLSDRIIFRGNLDREYSSELVGQLQSAITSFNIVHISYSTIKGKNSERHIEPFALYHTHENWLLIAYCRLRKSFRSFRVDLIQNIRVKDEHFESHKMTLEEYFEKS